MHSLYNNVFLRNECIATYKMLIILKFVKHFHHKIHRNTFTSGDVTVETEQDRQLANDGLRCHIYLYYWLLKFSWDFFIINLKKVEQRIIYRDSRKFMIMQHFLFKNYHHKFKHLFPSCLREIKLKGMIVISKLTIILIFSSILVCRNVFFNKIR